MCALFGPSAAGGAYIPAFCDVVVMVEGNASMYLGSDRMVEMVTGEKTTLEEMGGREDAHHRVRGRASAGRDPSEAAIDAVRRYLSYLPVRLPARTPPAAAAGRPGQGRPRGPGAGSERQAFDMRRYAKGSARRWLVLRDPRAGWAREVLVGLGRLNGRVVGIVGNNSMFRGGVLFVDSADKATHFVQLCDAFNIPLIFLADVPVSWWAPTWSGRGSSGTAPR